MTITTRLCLLLLVLLFGLWFLMTKIEHGSSITIPVTFDASFHGVSTKKTSDLRWEEIQVQPSDTLYNVFDRVGLDSDTMYAVLAADRIKHKALRTIYPKETLLFGFRGEQLARIDYIPSVIEQYSYKRITQNASNELVFRVEAQIHEPEVDVSYQKVVINHSLFMDGKKAGLSESLILDIASIFTSSIDFVYDIRRGDSFDVMYEELYFNGEKIGNGNILMVNFTNRGKRHTAYHFTRPNKEEGYYSPKGENMRKAFMLAPLDYTRVSSRFNPRRLHPVFKTLRPHRGIDYAAPRGTPVYAAGDGKVTKAGFTRANGNYVFIAHGTRYVTKYLHLHKRVVRTGQTVNQGQLIGTVGSTGYATGPHLHYEFLVDGVHKNPSNIVQFLPTSSPLPPHEVAMFKKAIEPIKLQYQQLAFVVQ